MPYHGSNVERLQAVIAAQRDVMACGLELQRVMDVTTARTRELTTAAAAVIELREGDQMVYHSVAGSAVGSLGVRLNVNTSLSGRSVLEARILSCTDTESDPRVDLAAARRVGARSMLCVPLFHEAAAVGVLKVYSPECAYFDDEDVKTLELMVGFISIATAKAVAQRARELSEGRFRALAELATDGIITADASGTVTFWNQSAARMFGHGEGYLIGKAFTELMPPRYALAEALSAGRFDPRRAEKLMGRLFELNGLRSDGTEFPVELSASTFRVGDGSAEQYFTAIVRDVTERKRLEAEVLKLARTDQLTGLMTRRAGQELIDREAARRNRYGEQLSFILFDVDHFKAINDSAGHGGGDLVLQRIGALVLERVRATDVAVRWGGEEFLLMLPHTPHANAAELAEDLRRRVADSAFDVVEHATISLGVAELAEGEPVGRCIARADAKLYAAKHAGRNRVAA